MNFEEIQQQLNDLPPTYLRTGTPFTQLVDAQTAELANYGYTSDSVASQTNFDNAVSGWLDCFGLLFGVQRQLNEPDATYRTRITATLLAWVGTPAAISQWILFIFGVQGTVTENITVLASSQYPIGAVDVTVESSGSSSIVIEWVT